MPDKYWLDKGDHPDPATGRCAMEWVAYLAGEPHTDEPACVSQVLRTFCMGLNDNFDDEDRQRLRPYLARTIGTWADGHDGARLALLDRFVRERGGDPYPICTCVVCMSDDTEALIERAIFIASHEVEAGLKLLHDMLPTEPLELPKAPDWQALCQVMA